jgi:hypothetical protein
VSLLVLGLSGELPELDRPERVGGDADDGAEDDLYVDIKLPFSFLEDPSLEGLVDGMEPNKFSLQESRPRSRFRLRLSAEPNSLLKFLLDLLLLALLDVVFVLIDLFGLPSLLLLLRMLCCEADELEYWCL